MLSASRVGLRLLGRQSPAIEPSYANNIEYRRFDLADRTIDYQPLLEGCDAVVHLAGKAHDPAANASLYNELNHVATRRLAEAAAEAGVRHFLYVSTIKVNGGEQRDGVPPYTEASPVEPTDAYALSKWQGEQALRASGVATGMRHTILRPPLIYGPGVKANFRSLMRLVHRGVPLPLASVSNQRSLLYVDNLCDVICRLLERESHENSTYVIKDETLSTPGLIRAMAEGLDVKPRLFSLPVSLLRLAGKMTGKQSMIDRLTGSLVVDDSVLRRDLDWQPPVSLEQGVKETAAWFVNS